MHAAGLATVAMGLQLQQRTSTEEVGQPQKLHSNYQIEVLLLLRIVRMNDVFQDVRVYLSLSISKRVQAKQILTPSAFVTFLAVEKSNCSVYRSQ